MLCEEMMHRDVERISPRDTVEDAAVKMRDNKIGFLPVCDQSGKVVGTLTDRDIAVRLVAAKKAGTTMVEDVMSRGVIACGPKDDLQKVQMLMAKNHVSRVMCIDSAGSLVGVISLSDIAIQGQGAQVADTLKRVSEREAKV